MTIPVKVRKQLHDRAQDSCEMCGKYGANNAHHRQARSQGGDDVLSNLLLLCGSGIHGCHGFITTNEHGVRLGKPLGWILHRNMVPSEEPVWRFDPMARELQRVFLDDEGGITPESRVAA